MLQPVQTDRRPERASGPTQASSARRAGMTFAKVSRSSAGAGGTSIAARCTTGRGADTSTEYHGAPALQAAERFDRHRRLCGGLTPGRRPRCCRASRLPTPRCGRRPSSLETLTRGRRRSDCNRTAALRLKPFEDAGTRPGRTQPGVAGHTTTAAPDAGAFPRVRRVAGGSREPCRAHVGQHPRLPFLHSYQAQTTHLRLSFGRVWELGRVISGLMCARPRLHVRARAHARPMWSMAKTLPNSRNPPKRLFRRRFLHLSIPPVWESHASHRPAGVDDLRGAHGSNRAAHGCQPAPKPEGPRRKTPSRGPGRGARRRARRQFDVEPKRAIGFRLPEAAAFQFVGQASRRDQVLPRLPTCLIDRRQQRRRRHAPAGRRLDAQVEEVAEAVAIAATIPARRVAPASSRVPEIEGRPAETIRPAAVTPAPAIKYKPPDARQEQHRCGSGAGAAMNKVSSRRHSMFSIHVWFPRKCPEANPEGWRRRGQRGLVVGMTRCPRTASNVFRVILRNPQIS